MHHITQILIFLTRVLQQQPAHTGIHRHFFIVKEAPVQVSEKRLLFQTHGHTFAWQPEISRAGTQYPTTKVVSYMEDLVFQDQSTETKPLRQQYFTIKTPHIQRGRNSKALLAFQLCKCLLFGNVFNAPQNKTELPTTKRE